MTQPGLGTGGLTADRRLTLAETNRLIGRDRKTLMKDIRSGRFPNAIQDATGRKGWTIPVGDLVAAGLIPPEAVSEIPGHLESVVHEGELAALRAENAELRAQLAAQTALAEERLIARDRTHELLRALLSSCRGQDGGGAP